MTTLILIRHGEVEGIDPPTFRGRSPLALTGTGLRQSEHTRDVLAQHRQIDAIFCSPLGRCVHTADTIAAGFGISAVPHNGFNDISYGAWTGLAVDEVAQRWPREAALWKSAPHGLRFPGGESLQDVAARAIDALGVIVQTHARDVVAIVSHDSVIRVLLCHALGLPLSAYWNFDPRPCGVSVVACDDERFTLRSFNETRHLDIA